MQRLTTQIIQMVKDTAFGFGIDVQLVEKLLQPAREFDQGDLTLPCFAFSKSQGRSPQDLAESLAQAFPKHAALQDVIATNGYLNFRAHPTWLAETLLTQGHSFSSTRQPQHVLIEHTSANPNGPFHVGRARNAILGDTLVRLHRLWGNTVTAEYYVDDMGKQVAVLAWALEALNSEEVEALLAQRDPPNLHWANKADHQRVRFYQAAQLLRNENARAAAIEDAVAQLVHASEHGDSHVLKTFEAAYQPVLDGMLETLRRLGIEFDRFTKESTFVINGDVSSLMEHLATLDIHGQAENGAKYLDLGQRGLKGKTEFFYQRGDGSSLYATRDIAYHIWKGRQESHLINVLGEDHKLQAQQVGLTLEELGVSRPEVVFYSFIKLPEGKMSTRKGNVVFMDDLLEEAKAQAEAVVMGLRPDYTSEQISAIAEAVGTSAIRFNIINVSPEKGFTFRWEDALSFEGGSAPFVMYSHTRACSIQKNVIQIEPNLKFSNLQIPSELPTSLVTLLRHLAVHDDCLEKVLNEHRPHLFAEYLLQLATAYNAFYRDCHIIEDGQVNRFYYAVSESTRKVLHDGMIGLGVTPLDTM